MKIIFKRADDSVAVMTLAEGADKDETIKKFLNMHEGEYIDHFEYMAELPDYKHRDAWIVSGNKIIVKQSEK